MKILYVTSEASPFCKTGGLADVAGSLPPALAANGDDVAVILPLYGQIGKEWKEKISCAAHSAAEKAGEWMASAQECTCKKEE